MYALHIYIRNKENLEKTLVGEMFFNSYEHALAAIADGVGDIIGSLPEKYAGIDWHRPYIVAPSLDDTGFGTDLEFRYADGEVVISIFKPLAMD